jgi:hypothetical protein
MLESIAPRIEDELTQSVSSSANIKWRRERATERSKQKS